MRELGAENKNKVIYFVFRSASINFVLHLDAYEPNRNYT